MTDRIINLRDWEAAALNEGRATALVRVCKPQPPEGHKFHGFTISSSSLADDGNVVFARGDRALLQDVRRIRCPFGAPGDAILGREAMYLHKHAGARGGWLYRADNSQVSVIATDDDAVREMREWAHKTARSHCSSTQMPSWAIRARYTNAGVRCLRVQELTEQDARDLGFFAYSWADDNISSRIQYAEQFTQDHGPGAWSANPWVFIARLTK